MFDDRLATWWRADPFVSAIENAEIATPCVYTNLLINADRSLSIVDLSGLPKPGELTAASLYEFVEYLTGVAVPTLDAFAEPKVAVAAFPSSWLSGVGAETVEWAIACGERDAATELIRRCVRQPMRGLDRWEMRIEQFRYGWDLAESAARLSQPPLGFRALGWLARTHSLLAPDDLGASDWAKNDRDSSPSRIEPNSAN